MRGILIAASLGVVLAGCGGDDKSSPGTTTPPGGTPPGGTTPGGTPPPSTGTFQATCNNIARNGECETYISGFTAPLLSGSQTDCTTASIPGAPVGTWSTTAACPSTNRLGRCQYTMSGYTFSIGFYSGSEYTSADVANLQTACTTYASGTWTAN